MVSEFTESLADTLLAFPFASHMHISRHKFFYTIYAGIREMVREVQFFTATNLQIGLPREENFSSYSVIIFPEFMVSSLWRS